MKRVVLCLFLAIIPLLAPEPAMAWGAEGHRLIVERAIELLPPALKPYYERHRAFILEHASDPDYWRTAGFAEEAPRHFLDLDAYGTYPFAALPRDLGSALRQHGPETITKNGMLPWRIEEQYGRLARAFASQGPYASDDARFLSAILAHYVADAHVPLHAVLNYDGQLSGQWGVHGRFESEAFRRASPLTLSPSPATPVADPVQAAFTALLAGFQLVDPILKADVAAVGDRTEYDDGYYASFVQATRPILEKQCAAAASLVASMWIGAWESAGRPDLTVVPAPRVEKVRRRDR
jgi:hypothetical protein